MFAGDIIKEAGRMFRVHPRDIVGPSKFGFIMPARFALCLALYRRGSPYTRVGRWLNRDHSTVIHGAKRAQYMMERDPDFAAKVQRLVDYK